MSRAACSLLFHPLTTFPFPSNHRFEADFGNLRRIVFLSLPRFVSSMSDQIPILSIRLDFLEELPDDSVRHAMVNIRLRRCQMGGLQSAKIIQARSLTSLLTSFECRGVGKGETYLPEENRIIRSIRCSAPSIRFLTISCLKGLVRARLASTQVLALDSMQAKPTRNFASPLSPGMDQNDVEISLNDSGSISDAVI